MGTPGDVSWACHFHVRLTVLKSSDATPRDYDSYFTSKEARMPRRSRNVSLITYGVTELGRPRQAAPVSSP